ncbi:MAG TPA: cell division protein FtsZ, partial [bacterium]|nr:cell division protein FtsZ [bacterium]
ASAAAEIISNAADENANIIFGTAIDESVEGVIRVTVVATGFGEAARSVVSTDESAWERQKREKTVRETHKSTQYGSDSVDIPPFLRESGI